VPGGAGGVCALWHRTERAAPHRPAGGARL